MTPTVFLMLNKDDIEGDEYMYNAISLGDGTTAGGVSIASTNKITIGTLGKSHFVNVGTQQNEISDVNGIKIYIDYDDSRIVFAKFDGSKFAYLNLAPPS
jgi:hypothetical protein